MSGLFLSCNLKNVSFSCAALSDVMSTSRSADDPHQEHSSRPRRFQPGLPYLCLLLLGLMVTLPFLQPVRAMPLIHFYNEWLAIALGLGAGVTLLARSFWTKLFVPRLAIYLLGVMVLIAIQAVFIKPTYTTQILLPLLYLAWAILLATLTAWLREQLGPETVLRVLAYFILAGGTLHALIGIAQYLGFYSLFGPLVDPRIIVNITGNIGQQNHFATHLTLAMLALFYLFALHRMPWGATIALLVLFAFVLSLSGSRSILLYALGALVLSFHAYRKTKNHDYSRLAWLSGLLLALILLCQYSLPWLNEWLKEILASLGFNTSHLEILTAAQRGPASGIEQRLAEWHRAWLMFLSAPLIGVGTGNYGWHSFILRELPEFSGASSTWELYHHAHNLFLEMLAELGSIGLLLLLVLLISWLRQFRKNWPTPENWFIAAVLLVLFVHSNLEYPYWYSYFLGILTIFLVLGDARQAQVTFTPRLGQIGTAVSLLLLFSILAVTFTGYRKLTNISAMAFLQYPEETTRALRSISMNPLLTPWADAAMITHSRPDKSNVEQRLALMTRVMRHQPDNIRVRQQIVYLALAGRMDEASSLLKHAARAYAPVFPEYICDFKKLPDEEILPLIAEGERILGGSPACRPRNKPGFLLPSSIGAS